MGVKLYIKRAIKYIVKEHRPIIIKPEIVQKTPNEMLKDKNILITGGRIRFGVLYGKKIISRRCKSYYHRKK